MSVLWVVSFHWSYFSAVQRYKDVNISSRAAAIWHWNWNILLKIGEVALMRNEVIEWGMLCFVVCVCLGAEQLQQLQQRLRFTGILQHWQHCHNPCSHVTWSIPFHFQCLLFWDEAGSDLSCSLNKVKVKVAGLLLSKTQQTHNPTTPNHSRGQAVTWSNLSY